MLINNQAAPDRVVILSTEHEVIAVQQLAAALSKLDNIFQRDQRLVYILDGTVRLVDKPYLAHLLSQRVAFARITSSSTRLCLFPQRWLDIVLSLGEWDVPHLRGVSYVPLVGASGNVVLQKGFSHDHQLYLTDDWSDLDIPEQPTLADARAALDFLRDVFSDIAYSDQRYADNTICCLATIAWRFWMQDDAMPAYLVTAHAQAAGKTTLARVIHTLATGRDPSVISESQSNEWQKMITSFLLSDTPTVILDNIQAITDNAIATYITSGRWTARLLGTNQMVDLPARSVLIATGNNVSMNMDLFTRFVPIELDVSQAGKWRSTNPIREAHAMRRAVVRALTIIYVAWVRNGMPLVPSGTRFTVWDERVFSPLGWAGAQIYASPSWSAETETELTPWIRFFEAVQSLKHGDWTARDVAKMLMDGESGLAEHAPRVMTTLRTEASVLSYLGKNLRKLKKAFEATDYRLVDTKINNVVYWRMLNGHGQRREGVD